MKPATYDLELIENSTNTRNITISGITTAEGYSAIVELRVNDNPRSELLLQLTSSPVAGLTVTSNGTDLIITMRITETQVDDLSVDLVANDGGYWSLKLITPSGDTLQYLHGSVSIFRTPTA